jgi:hypothetical protein
MEPQKRNLTTEDTEEKIIKYKNSVPTVVLLILSVFSEFSVVRF